MATGKVRVRRVYQEPEQGDGTRVLVDRLWPRGLSKVRAAFDDWCKNVAPSEELRTWYGHDPDRFEDSAAATSRNCKIRGGPKRWRGCAGSRRTGR